WARRRPRPPARREAQATPCPDHAAAASGLSSAPRPTYLGHGNPWRRPMQEALIVRREQHVPAPQAAVFALLTDPEKILRWMGTEAQVDPRPGGLYLFNVPGARSARGACREVGPVHRLAYSFGWDGSEEVPPGSSLIE